MDSTVRIKEEVDQPLVKMVKKEHLDEMEMGEQLLQAKVEPQPGDKESLTNFTSANQSEQLVGDVSSFAFTSLDDDSDRMPSDWFCGESSDSEEEIVDDEESVNLSADSVSNFATKEEPENEESWSTFASTQPASPSIVIKGETCPCTGHCHDCLAKRSPPCPECGKTFASNANLKIHLRVHTGERPFVCAQCPKAFKQLGNLKYHQVTHQAVRSRPFKCTTEGCGKAFTTKQSLTRHIQSHTGERPFVCAACSKAFTQMGHLQQHQLTHQAVRSRPFSCTAEGCWKDFPRKSELTVHFRTHTGDKPFKCDTCGKAFATKGQLTIHHRSHTGERPYQCPLCPKAFATSSHAKYHQRTFHPTCP